MTGRGHFSKLLRRNTSSQKLCLVEKPFLHRMPMKYQFPRVGSPGVAPDTALQILSFEDPNSALLGQSGDGPPRVPLAGFSLGTSQAWVCTSLEVGSGRGGKKGEAGGASPAGGTQRPPEAVGRRWGEHTPLSPVILFFGWSSFRWGLINRTLSEATLWPARSREGSRMLTQFCLYSSSEPRAVSQLHHESDALDTPQQAGKCLPLDCFANKTMRQNLQVLKVFLVLLPQCGSIALQVLLLQLLTHDIHLGL